MNDETIERLAREAGFSVSRTRWTCKGQVLSEGRPYLLPDNAEELERFAALIAEECAKVCERQEQEDCCGELNIYRECANAIRERFGNGE